VRTSPPRRMAAAGSPSFLPGEFLLFRHLPSLLASIGQLPSLLSLFSSTGRFILDKFACSSQGTPAIVGRNDLHLPSLPLPSVSVPSTSGSCKSDEFFWSPKSVCLPTFSWSSCPKTQHTDYSKSCPSSWYFHSSHKCCVPRAPRIDLQPKICAQSSWNWFGKELCCKSAPPTSVSDCSSSSTYPLPFPSLSSPALLPIRATN
jgi:hypothetical protein